ncbi:MAG: hypothetical protein GTO45_19185 [Candidatus Aminicenantes bacterium]|nr:hypothetical protein [Candidatus Aminicenantes bacterium]NIM80911.1 hypothetical protein [Candidatus Aminicenantes bacterium]NIN20299.1 hypothetical protein [Candidatus Aminicenantes bacterium]NIN44074.1 hypothetical protein [Candidatus Aminicenantes bacterium]NIN86886.1 hypothetical protein [Candidatus Aminicenantes bacterium]
MINKIQFILLFFLFLFFCNKVSLFPIGHVNKKWGFIDKTGKVVIETKFYIIGFFFEGLAEVCIKR